VQRAGFIAAVIHNIYADSLVRMHGTASKQQTNVQFCKTKQYLEICFYCKLLPSVFFSVASFWYLEIRCLF